MSIDRNAWQKGILKAAFNFIFDHSMGDEEYMWWKGLIYAKIENSE
ncbi:MAG: hypothetical protein LBV72_08405 [Tannerella sp.]|jgi:hypothetical protein|nr:hypothetical protein [Tannerella sp.]